MIMALGIAELQQLRSVLSWSWLGRAKDAVQSLNSLNEPNFVFCKKPGFAENQRVYLVAAGGGCILVDHLYPVPHLAPRSHLFHRLH